MICAPQDVSSGVAEYLHTKDVMAFACLCKLTNCFLTRETPSGRKLCMPQAIVDLEESSSTIFQCMVLHEIKRVILTGSCEDLPEMLNYICSLTTREDWHVQEFSINEEISSASRCTNSMLTSWYAALRIFIACLCRTTLQRCCLRVSRRLDSRTIDSLARDLSCSACVNEFHYIGPGRLAMLDIFTRLGWQCSSSTGWLFGGYPGKAQNLCGDRWMHVSSELLGSVHVRMCRFPDRWWRQRRRIDKLTGQAVNAPSMIVISHTGWITGADEDHEINCFNAAGIMQHYLIACDGGLLQFVDIDKRAWHAGQSFWGAIGSAGIIGGVGGVNDVNSHSIGITLQGDGCQGPFTGHQYCTLNALLWHLKRHCCIQGINIVGMGEVACPPGRTAAPGKYFDWDMLETFDATLASRHRIIKVMKDLPATQVEEDSLRLIRSSLGSCGYSLGTSESHFNERVNVVADRYVGVEGPRDWASMKLCARALALWHVTAQSNICVMANS